MARQSGVIMLTGRIGGLSFYHNKSCGYIARQKGGPSAEQIAKDPQFERTRENASEFGNAVKAAMLIRHTLRSTLHLKGDSTVTQRLNKVVVAIAKMDPVSVRGARVFAHGITNSEAREQLASFAFHGSAPLRYVLPYRIAYTAASGTFGLSGLVPGRDMPAPAGATHVRLQGMTGFFDFDRGVCMSFVTQEVVLPLDDSPHDVGLAPEAVPMGTGVQLAFLSVVYLQEQNGAFYQLREGTSAGSVFF